MSVSRNSHLAIIAGVTGVHVPPANCSLTFVNTSSNLSSTGATVDGAGPEERQRCAALVGEIEQSSGLEGDGDLSGIPPVLSSHRRVELAALSQRPRSRRSRTWVGEAEFLDPGGRDLRVVQPQDSQAAHLLEVLDRGVVDRRSGKVQVP